jgi:hypothetical protein
LDSFKLLNIKSNNKKESNYIDFVFYDKQTEREREREREREILYKEVEKSEFFNNK